ncbi:MAG: hypothetical protein PUP93_20610 [Rhizonema sp. NSF051]|nr:hypothetical protein [Rhizonema sp. NSF051]
MNNMSIAEMSKKTTIVLPDVIYEDLARWAELEGRPTANLAAFLVEQSVRAKYPEKYPPPATGRSDK